MSNYKKTFSGDKIEYKFDNIYGVYGWQYICIIVGLMLIISITVGYYNKYIEMEILEGVDIIWLIICVSIGCLMLRLGIKNIVKKQKFKKMYYSLKNNGKKAVGKIKKVYRFSRHIRQDGVPIRFPEFILKISYYDEYKNEEKMYLSPKISGNAYDISDDKIIVYYDENNIAIDELNFDSENPIEFEEGIFVGTPDMDTKEYNDFLKKIDKLPSKEKAMELLKYRNQKKKK